MKMKSHTGYLSVSNESRLYENIRELNQMDKKVIDEIEEFFKNYVAASGKEFMCKGDTTAEGDEEIN